MRWFFAIVFLLPTSAWADTTLYGAQWCGPCQAVRQWLTQNQVPFRYVDVDEPQTQAEYEKVRGPIRSIPLTVVNGQKIIGSNYEVLAQVLLSGKQLAPVAAASGEVYGGQPPAWWQQQFRALRALLAQREAEVRQLQKEAQFDDEKERLKRLKRNFEQVEAALNQLENDASRVSLPRNYRQ